MTTPHTTQTIILVIVSVLLAAMLIASAYEWRRTGRATMTLLILGGAVCCLNEPLADVLGHCYFPTDGWMAQTLLGRTIPIWVDVTYASFFGAFPYLLALALRRGISRRTMWLAIVAFWVADLVLEIPLLGSHLYIYYGKQPLKVGGFPLFWLTINVLGALFTAVLVTRFDGFFTGRRQALLLVIPFATYMASWVVDMPGFWALNSTAATGVKYFGVAAAMVLGVFAIDGLIRAGLTASAAEAGRASAEPAVAPAEPARELQPA